MLARRYARYGLAMSLQSGAISVSHRYRPELDGVRAVAILCVLAFHAFFVGVRPRFAGFLGVDVFFVLSGYLITSLLLSEHHEHGRIDLGAFWARRGLRLLPALLVMLVLAGLVVVAVGQLPDSDDFPTAAAFVVLYIGNWKVRTLGVLSHAWSLAIEEQFYLLWPPTLLLALRRRISREALAGLLLLGAAATAVLMFRFGRIPTTLPYAADVVVETYARSIGILLGCTIALVPAWWTWTRNAAVPLAATAVAVWALVVDPRKTNFHYRYGISVFAVAVAVVLAHVAQHPSGLYARVLATQPLPAIGRVSYGIYLYHVPVFWYIGQRRFVDLGLPSLGLALVVVAAITVASYLFIERPALRLKDRFRPKERVGEV